MNLKLTILTIATIIFTGFSAKSQYCGAGPSSTFDTDINGVTLAGDDRSIINNSGCPGVPGVMDFTAQTADLVLNNSYSVTVEISSCGGFYNSAAQIWIDWNQNQTFDANESIGTWSGMPPSTQNFNFSVPSTALLGNTRMRVMLFEGGSIPLNPCSQFTWGAVEDYSINVMATLPPCPAPKNLALVSADTTSATLSWNSSGSSAWNIEYGPAGFTLGNGIQLKNIVSNPFTIPNLQSGAVYDFYVQDTCASIPAASNFSTPLRINMPIAAPHFEGFDLVNPPALPFGWSQSVFGVFTFSLPSATTSNGSGFNEPAPLSMPNQAWLNIVFGNNFTQNDTIYLISPPIFDLSSGLNRLRFSAQSNSGINLEVGIMSDPNNHGTFNQIASVGPLLPNYQEFAINVTNYSGPTAHLVFKYYGTQNTSDPCFIDNIYWEPIPIHEIGVTGFDAPLNPIVLGNQNVEVSVKNYGTDPLANATIGWQVNGVAQTPYSLSLTAPNLLNVDQTASNILLGSFNFTNSINIVRAYTSNPNGFPDENNANDTSTAVFCSGLSGTYTAGGPTDDFPNAATVFDALKSCGLVGNTIINFRKGTYRVNEELYQIIGLNGQYQLTISGDSAQNTFFVSEGSGQNTAVLLLDSVENVSLKNITFQSNASQVGRGVMVRNGCNNILIDSCAFVASNPLQNNNLQVVGVFLGPDMFSNFVLGVTGNHVTVQNSSFSQMASALQVAATPQSRANQIHFINNTITAGFSNGVRVQNTDSLFITNNTMRQMVNTFANGIDINNAKEFFIHHNEIYVDNRALILVNVNDTSGVVGEVINNILRGENGGIEINTSISSQILHNSVYGNPSIILQDAQSIDCRNNIFTADAGLVFNAFNASFIQFDYNIYNNSGLDFGSNNGGTVSSFAAFQAALPLYNVNSFFGNPQFTSSTNFRINYGLLANDNGDNTVNVTVDIDGEPRPASGSTNPDIGADEYTPPTLDLGLNALLSQKGLCFSDTDTVAIQIINYGLNNLNFTTDSFYIHWSITGPTNQSGMAVFKADSLASGDTAFVTLPNTVNYRKFGTYTFNAYLSADWDSLAINDSLVNVEVVVPTLLAAKGDTLLNLPGISVNLEASSPILNNVLISEIVQFKTGTGQTNPYPTYLPTGDFDMAEIANVGTSTADLSGYIFEVYDFGGFLFSYQVPNNVNISPQSVLLLGFGNGMNIPANNLYWMNGINTSSNVPQGYILKNPSGVIVDAVATNGFGFPVSSGVTPSDWTGIVSSSSGLAGIIRTGTDNNTAADWSLSSITNAMSIGTFNPGLDTVPSANLNWYLDTNLVDTLAQITVGPFVNNGFYHYVASIQSSCGLVTDTVLVEVDIPYPDTGLVDVVIDSIGITDDLLCNASQTGVKMYLTNTGTDTVFYIPAGYVLNNQPTVVDLIIDTLYPGILTEVSFNIPLNLTTNGNQLLQAWVVVSGDTLPVNDTNTFAFNNRSLPTSPLASQDSSYCPGTSVQPIFAQGSGGVIRWYTSAQLDSSSLIGQTDTIVPFSNPGSTNYFVTETDSFGCQSLADTVIVGIFGFPNANAGGNTSVCIGSAKTLSASGGVFYVWSNGVQGAFNNVSPTTPTQYSVTVTDINGCVAADTILVDIDTLPHVSFNINPQPLLCANDGAFTLTGGFPVGGFYSGNNVSANQFFPSNAGLGTDTVFYTFTNNKGCVNSDYEVFIVDSVPNVTLNGLPSLCTNDAPITLTGGLPTGGFYAGPGVAGGIFTPAQSGGAGNKFITYTYTDANGCSNSVTNTLVTLAPPNVTLTAFPAICEDYLPFALTGGKPVGGVYSGAGVVNDTLFPPLAGTGNIPISYELTGTNGCTGKVSRNISIDAKPAQPKIFTYLVDSLMADVNAPLYQWYYNGAIYPEVTKVIYAQLSGFYQVEAISGTCNSDRSEEHYFEVSSINDLEFENTEITVFPNPANNMATISSNSANLILGYKLFDVFGKVIQHQVVSPASNNQMISLKELSNGVYFLAIELNNGQIAKYKLVKN